MSIQELIVKAIDSVSLKEMRRNKNLRKQSKKLLELTFKLKNDKAGENNEIPNS
ncbi:MAG: hypothetical protein HRT44_08750 [Bdellovibrionales bacterium]|nr:hypothetical protein [Bdellovibrionales bacterium]